MVNKRFSLYDAYSFGVKTVINHFGFFLVAMLLSVAVAVFVLSLLGIADYMMFKEHFEIITKSVTYAMNNATGLIRVAGYNVHEYVKMYLPESLSTHLVPSDVVSIDISREDINEMFKFLLPIVLGFKLFLEVISIGWTKIALDLQANKTVEYDYLYKFFYLVPRVLIVEIMVGVITMIGFLLFIFPGVFVYQRLRFARYYIIDKNQSMMQALESSWKTTEGSVIHLCGYSVFHHFLMAIGRLFFPAMFFLEPLRFQVDANVYRQINK